MFLVVGLFTLNDYGLNWDSAKHYRKGQAYLHYILTGEKTYESLPDYPSLNPETGPGPQDWEPYEVGQGRTYEEAVWEGWSGRKRSFNQTDGLAYKNMVEDELDGFSHPAGNDLSAAITNYIFYQKLGILGDYQAHNLFILLISFVSVLAVSYFAYREFGSVASLLAGFFYGFYPLHFAEAHFNIKDPVVTAYITLTIIVFYYAIKNVSYKLLFLASIFAGLGLSTKLNIVFTPIIILPWLLLYLIKARREQRKNIKFYLSFIFIPAVAYATFVLTWPYLWHDVLAGTVEMLLYYLDIGVGGNNLVYEPYIYLGINFYPIYFILATTPIPMLLLFTVGIVASINQIVRKHKFVYVLVLIWFVLPILRVSTPQATIYGGVRQIMEYVPAMALLAGVGGQTIYSKIKNKKLSALVLVGLVGIMSWEMIKIHPNQNVYFNQLVGGLSGAAEKQIPYWGNSFGNAYLQGIEWLNKNAEPNAKVANILFTDNQLPFQSMRSDISLSNTYWSGPKLGGEYVIELYTDMDSTERYRYAYYDHYLKSVYELKEQNMPILKIWKNAPEYLVRDITLKSLEIKDISIDPFEAHPGKERVIVDLGEIKKVGLVVVKKGEDCILANKDNIVFVAQEFDKWERIYEVLGSEVIPKDSAFYSAGSKNKYASSDKQISLPIADKKARYVIIEFYIEDRCVYENPQIEIWGLD